MGKTLLPEGFEISESMRSWAQKKVPNIDIDSQHEAFLDYWKSHGKKMADWAATWRMWMRRVPDFTRFPKPVETPCFKPLERSIAPPVHIREHPLFRRAK
jgi:hypothetical protein